MILNVKNETILSPVGDVIKTPNGGLNFYNTEVFVTLEVLFKI